MDRPEAYPTMLRRRINELRGGYRRAHATTASWWNGMGNPRGYMPPRKGALLERKPRTSSTEGAGFAPTRVARRGAESAEEILCQFPQEYDLVSPSREETRPGVPPFGDRKSTRLNSSHLGISYAVF